MIDGYESIDNFETIVTRATDGVELYSYDSSNIAINLKLQFDFDSEMLQNPQLLDVSDKAAEWQSVGVPPSTPHIYILLMGNLLARRGLIT